MFNIHVPTCACKIQSKGLKKSAIFQGKNLSCFEQDSNPQSPDEFLLTKTANTYMYTYVHICTYMMYIYMMYVHVAMGNCNSCLMVFTVYGICTARGLYVLPRAEDSCLVQ